MYDHPEQDDQGPLTAEEAEREPEPICDNCADLGCTKCDPELAFLHHTAAAFDKLFPEVA